MNNVLFSAVGDTDPVRGGYDGPILHIVRKYRPVQAHLFFTAEMSRRDRDTNCYALAIRHVAPMCEVVKHYSDIENASDFDAFHARFGEIIGQISDQNPDARILLNISSATPQIKTTMCLEAVSNHIRLIPVQVTNPENKTGRNMPHFDPYKDDLKAELENLYDNLEEANDRCSEPDILCFKKSVIKNRIKELVRQYDYMGASHIARDNAEFFGARALKLLSHAFHRSRQNAHEAEKIAREIGIFDELYPVKESSVKNVCEYYLVMKIKCARGEREDFFMRLPNAAEYLAQEFLNVSGFNMNDIACFHDGRFAWRIDEGKARRNQPKLMDYLSDQIREKNSTDFANLRIYVNLRIYLHIMNFLFAESHADMTGHFNAIYECVALRNKAAHQLRPLSDDDLKGKPSPKELCSITERMIREIYKNRVKGAIFGVYERIGELISEALDR